MKSSHILTQPRLRLNNQMQTITIGKNKQNSLSLGSAIRHSCPSVSRRNKTAGFGCFCYNLRPPPSSGRYWILYNPSYYICKHSTLNGQTSGIAQLQSKAANLSHLCGSCEPGEELTKVKNIHCNCGRK